MWEKTETKNTNMLLLVTALELNSTLFNRSNSAEFMASNNPQLRVAAVRL